MGFHHPRMRLVIVPLGNGQVNLQVNITLAARQLATLLFDSRVGYSGSSYLMIVMIQVIQDRGSKGRCHGNRFWDYISCEWPLTGHNDMAISYKGLVFSQPYVCLSLSLSLSLSVSLCLSPVSSLRRWEMLLQVGDCQVWK